MERHRNFLEKEKILPNETVGIIGYGRFGKLLHAKLFPRQPTVVFDTKVNIDREIIQSPTVEYLASISSIIIPSVPISHFAGVIEKLAPFIKPGSLVMDVCSVKEFPTQVMLEGLPPSVNIISTHPMFGPKTVESTNGSLDGLTMVMSNTRCDLEVYERMKKHFQSLGLTVVEISPAEHDALAARSQFFAQTLRHLVQKLALEPTKIDTIAARNIFNALSLMGNDESLFRDMITYNKYCRTILNDMMQVLTALQEQ